MESNSCPVRAGNYIALTGVTEHACCHTLMDATIVEQITPPKTVMWWWGAATTPSQTAQSFPTTEGAGVPKQTAGRADRDYRVTLGTTDDGRTR